ncbi:MAG: hypothetical protein ACK58T_31720 [Phycisphaerae bacterium]
MSIRTVYRAMDTQPNVELVAPRAFARRGRVASNPAQAGPVD